jgi:CheY-like chemotaxis protein
MQAKTILVVDDNPDARFVYHAALEYGGYDVIEALDGREGLTRAQQVQPDLIIMDVSMPILDGLSAAEMLRADPATANIPILGVTGEDFSLDDRRRALQVFTHLYRKPLPPKELMRVVGVQIGEGGASPVDHDHEELSRV